MDKHSLINIEKHQKESEKKKVKEIIKRINDKNKLGLSCAKLSLASTKIHTSLSLDQLKLIMRLSQPGL